jgi:hypothetical protein
MTWVVPESFIDRGRTTEKELTEMAKLLKCKPLEVSGKVWVLLEDIKGLELERDRLTKQLKEGGKNNQ